MRSDREPDSSVLPLPTHGRRAATTGGVPLIVWPIVAMAAMLPVLVLLVVTLLA